MSTERVRGRWRYKLSTTENTVQLSWPINNIISLNSLPMSLNHNKNITTIVDPLPNVELPVCIV